MEADASGGQQGMDADGACCRRRCHGAGHGMGKKGSTMGGCRGTVEGTDSEAHVQYKLDRRDARW